MEERIKKALSIAWSYGQIDGNHHKMWVIDQMVRALCANEDEYTNWIKTYETPYEEEYYVWDIGVAP